jgi:hypothetical protein
VESSFINRAHDVFRVMDGARNGVDRVTSQRDGDDFMDHLMIVDAPTTDQQCQSKS